MADPLQTNVQVQDIPEYLRDYRSALLNAAFQSVFSKPHLAKNFPGATWYTGGAQGQPPQTPPPAAGAGGAASAGGGDTRTDTQVPESEADKAARGIAGALAMSSGQMPKILGMVWDPKTRTYVPEKYKPVVAMAGGGDLSELIDKYSAIREQAPIRLKDEVNEYIDQPTMDALRSMISGGVVNPVVGNMSPGGYASTWSIPGVIGTGVLPPPPPPDVSSGGGGGGSAPGGGSTGGTGGGAGGGTGGGVGSGGGGRGPIRSTGGGGGIGVALPPAPVRPGAGVTGAPPIGTPASAAVLPQFSAGPAGTTPESRGAGGYNPAQYATDQQAAGLASLLGSRVSSTNPIGPGAPPPQNILDFGDGAQLNAGLVQQALGNITVDGVSRARTPSEMTQSLAGLRAEIAAGGGDTSQIDRLIQQNTQAYTSGATASPVGRSAEGGSLARFEIGDDGKVKNYRKGGAIRKFFGGGFGMSPMGMFGGYGGYGGYGFPQMGNMQMQPAVMPNSPSGSGAFLEDSASPVKTSSGTPAQITPAQQANIDAARGGGARMEGSDQVKSSVMPQSPMMYPGSSFPGFHFGGYSMPYMGGYGGYGFPMMSGMGYGYPMFGGIGGFAPQFGGGMSMMQFDGSQGASPSRPSVYRPSRYAFSEGGSVKLQAGGPPNLGGFGAQQTPASGGFGGPGGLAGFWNAANPEAQVGTSMFNAPPVYGGQRNLMMGGDFGQYNPQIGYTVSDLTRGALGNLGDLPSVYGKMIGADKKEYTGILPGTDFGKGVSNINWASDIAGTAAGAGLNLLDQLGLSGMGPGAPQQQSYLMQRLTGPEGLEAKDLRLSTPISIDKLTAPTIAEPSGVTAGRTQVGEFGTPQAEQYMSPYQRAVTDTQKREAQRQAAMQKAARSAAAVRSGAFGGSRQAIQEGMAEEALQRQLGDIEAAGTQRAFESAQAQFERDRAASLASQQANLRAALEAQVANQQAGLTAGQANLQAALGTQQLGTTAGLEAAKANLGAQMGLTQAKLDAITRASQEQQALRQQDFTNKLAALQQAQAGAQGLAGMGGTLMGIPGMAQQLELQRLAAMQQGGGYIDALTRQAMDLQYQDFINQQNYPYQQMNFLQGILSGMPVGMQTEAVQFARPAAGGLSGLLTSGAGLLTNYLNK